MKMYGDTRLSKTIFIGITYFQIKILYIRIKKKTYPSTTATIIMSLTREKSLEKHFAIIKLFHLYARAHMLQNNRNAKIVLNSRVRKILRIMGQCIRNAVAIGYSLDLSDRYRYWRWFLSLSASFSISSVLIVHRCNRDRAYLIWENNASVLFGIFTQVFAIIINFVSIIYLTSHIMK